MDRIESGHLYMAPMTPDELSALIEQCRGNDPELCQAYTEMLCGCISEPEQYLWHTAWCIRRRESGEMVGDFCFKGLPENGCPEIGYGIIEAHQGKGYATEAIGAACRWALSQPGIKAVEAETAPDNTASQKVLSKLGFVPTGSAGEEGPRYILYSPD